MSLAEPVGSLPRVLEFDRGPGNGCAMPAILLQVFKCEKAAGHPLKKLEKASFLISPQSSIEVSWAAMANRLLKLI